MNDPGEIGFMQISRIVLTSGSTLRQYSMIKAKIPMFRWAQAQATTYKAMMNLSRIAEYIHKVLVIVNIAIYVRK